MTLTKAQIEWGKQNYTCWGRLTDEQKEILKEAGKLEILQRLMANTGKGECWVNKASLFKDFADIYRIDPAYQPEPEVVKCEIFIDHNNKYAFGLNDDTGRWSVSAANTFKDFICFEFADGSTSVEYRTHFGKFDKLKPAEIAKYVVFAKEL